MLPLEHECEGKTLEKRGNSVEERPGFEMFIVTSIIELWGK